MKDLTRPQVVLYAVLILAAAYVFTHCGINIQFAR